jgi:hypothetical protein
LRWDLGIGEWDSTNLDVAVYLCNQMIYSPERLRPRGLPRPETSASRHLRYVLPLSDPADSRVVAWLAGMKENYHLDECQTLTVNVAGPRGRPRIERYHLYEFTPREVIRQASRPERTPRG